MSLAHTLLGFPLSLFSFFFSFIPLLPACSRKRQHSLDYEPWLSFQECQALPGCDRKSSVSELPVITQPFLFLSLRVSVRTSSISSLLDNYEISNRRVLTIISYEAMDRGPAVSLLGLFVRPPLFVCIRGRCGLVF